MQRELREDWPWLVWYAWPSFDSFLLVLVATIMRALTIIAIESAYADTPYSVDEEMSFLGLATGLNGFLGMVPMNATSAMTDLNKEGISASLLKLSGHVFSTIITVALTNYTVVVIVIVIAIIIVIVILIALVIINSNSNS